MIDFDRFDITAIVRSNNMPFTGIKSLIQCSDLRESLLFSCTEEEHEKLVADYLAWKDAKDKTQCSIGSSKLKPMLTPEQIMLNRRERKTRKEVFVITLDGGYQVPITVNTLIYGDIDSVVDKIMNNIQECHKCAKNTDAGFIKNRIIYELANLISSMD